MNFGEKTQLPAWSFGYWKQHIVQSLCESVVLCLVTSVDYSSNVDHYFQSVKCATDCGRKYPQNAHGMKIEGTEG